MIRVISAAVNISTSARKLFRNEQNFELSSGLSTSCSFQSKIFFLFLYRIARSHSIFEALINFGSISNVSSDNGRICSRVIHFHEIVIPDSSITLSK